MPPYKQRSGGSPPRGLRAALRGARPPRYGSRRALVPWVARLRPARPAPRLRGWGLLSPPRHSVWGRGCGAARDGGNEGFRRLRAAGERHPSWVSRAHPSLPLRKIYHFIDSLSRTHCESGASCFLSIRRYNFKWASIFPFCRLTAFQHPPASPPASCGDCS